MSRFAGVLKRVSDGLDLPQPTRSRILLEMAGDLQDLYEHHLGQGMDEERAAQLIMTARERWFAEEETGE